MFERAGKMTTIVMTVCSCQEWVRETRGPGPMVYSLVLDGRSAQFMTVAQDRQDHASVGGEVRSCAGMLSSRRTTFEACIFTVFPGKCPPLARYRIGPAWDSDHAVNRRLGKGPFGMPAAPRRLGFSGGILFASLPLSWQLGPS